DAARAGGHRPARRDAGRSRRSRARVRTRPLRGARRRSAASRPERVSLADEGPDRGGTLVDLARGRGDPLQGGGIRMDARGGPAPAGVGRPACAAPGLRGARPSRPHPAAPRRGAGGVPLRARGERAGDPPVRDGRHGARPRLPERAVLRRLLLVRHGHARSNLGDHVSSLPPGEGLSEQGASEALALRTALASEELDLGVATPLLRTQETLDLALGFGAFEGGPLAEYRAWAWSHPPDAECPGGGESRTEAAMRIAAALVALLDRPEEVLLAVSHALPIRYVVDAS